MSGCQKAHLLRERFFAWQNSDNAPAHEELIFKMESE
jgi:hypothetical protein